MDWFVLLTPLVVLGVLLLLGYAGCHKVFGVDPVEPPPPTHTLTLEVRVPNEFTITLQRFVWVRPGATIEETTTMLQRRDEINTFVLSIVVDNAVGGDWRVACRLRVRDATAEQEDVTSYNLMLPADVDAVFLFDTSGRPSTNDFEVVPVGLQ